MDRARNRQRGNAVRRPRRIYLLRIVLQDTDPPIWRRLYVADDTLLEKLHKIFQTVMGWENYHLHNFQTGGVTYGPYDPDFGEDDMLDERGVRLRDIAPEVESMFVYEYDFGDGWEHLIQVEDVLEPTAGLKVPICLEGNRACPPEDCGGTYGYREFLEAISNRRHPRHRELLNWVGGEFDPEEFNLDEINLAL